MFRRQDHTVVFDIGSSTIKVVEGYVKEEKVNIEYYCILPTPQNTVQEGRLVDKKSLSEELSKLKIKASDVRLLLSSKDIILRTFKLPKMDINEIRQAVKFEMSVLLPEDIEHYIIDGVVLREYKETSEEDTVYPMYEVQGVAIERKTVMDYVDCFLKAGIKISIVDIQPNAICKLLYHQSLYMGKIDEKLLKNQNIAIIDMGHDKTSITFIENKQIFIHKTMDKGGKDFSKAIAQDLHMSFDQAEVWKVENDFFLKEKGEMNNLLLEIVGELTQLMEYFESMSKGQKISSALLLGGGFLMPICKKYIENRLHIKTDYFFTLYNMDIKEVRASNHMNYIANAIGSLIRREKP